jgi:hypothetical protein
MHYFGYRSCESSILFNRKQNYVGSDSEHFANLRHEKRCKTCVTGLNALFRGTEVMKHPFYSIGTKMIFRSVSSISLTFDTLKDGKLVLQA